MTIPGVDMVVALAIVAAIGEVGRFEQSQNLVSYLGLNPSVRQSGPGPAYHGRITKQGRGHARGMLVEAAWAAARAPGPLRACVSACNFGSDAISMTWPLSQAHDAGLEEVEVSATVHLTLDELQLKIWPSVCPLDHCKAIAASIAALSLGTPRANAATRLAWALLIQASRSARAFRRMIPGTPE